MTRMTGIAPVIHEPVSYAITMEKMAQSAILYLPSGDDMAYALPFKIFDYLRVRRPIFAVARRDSSVTRLMNRVDCGEIAEFGATGDVLRALRAMLSGERTYTYAGAEQFTWRTAVDKYRKVTNNVLVRADADKSAEAFAKQQGAVKSADMSKHSLDETRR